VLKLCIKSDFARCDILLIYLANERVLHWLIETFCCHFFVSKSVVFAGSKVLILSQWIVITNIICCHCCCWEDIFDRNRILTMDLSRCHNGGGLSSGLVFPRHPTSSPPSSDMLSKNGKKEVVNKNGSSGSSINPKTAFFSISNLVNGLRQQQEKGKRANNFKEKVKSVLN